MSIPAKQFSQEIPNLFVTLRGATFYLIEIKKKHPLWDASFQGTYFFASLLIRAIFFSLASTEMT